MLAGPFEVVLEAFLAFTAFIWEESSSSSPDDDDPIDDPPVAVPVSEKRDRGGGPVGGGMPSRSSSSVSESSRTSTEVIVRRGVGVVCGLSLAGKWGRGDRARQERNTIVLLIVDRHEGCVPERAPDRLREPSRRLSLSLSRWHFL